jgi:hypothetical protein
MKNIEKRSGDKGSLMLTFEEREERKRGQRVTSLDQENVRQTGQPRDLSGQHGGNSQ